MDLATLGLRIENGQVVAADQALQKLTGTAGRAEKSAVSLRGAFAAIGGYVLVREFMAVAAATREAELANVRLEGVLRATGNISGFTATQLDALANEMSRNTLFDDEAIKNAAARLATFGNVVGDVFTRALSLGADLATLTGEDITGAMQQLGKALEDPVRGVQLLTRAGIALSDAQREAVKTAIDHNRVAQAQGIILDALQAKVGGLAQGAHVGLTGALHDLTLEWGNFLEGLGQTPGVAQTVANAIALVADAIGGLLLTLQPTMAMLEEALRQQRADLQSKYNRDAQRGLDPTRGVQLQRGQEILELTRRIEGLRTAAMDAMHATGAAAAAAAGHVLTAVTEGSNAEQELAEIRQKAQIEALAGLTEIANRQQEATAATVEYQHALEAAAEAADRMSDKTVEGLKRIIEQAKEAARYIKGIHDQEGIGPAGGKGGGFNLGGILGGFAGGGTQGGIMALLGAIPGLGQVSGLFSGLIGSLFGSGEAARRAAEAEKALMDARLAFVASLASRAADLGLGFDVKSLGFGTGRNSRTMRYDVTTHAITAMDAELARSANAFDEMEKRARELDGAGSALALDLAKIAALRKAEAEQIRAAFALKQRELQEDYGVRALRAQGRTEEADALAFAQQQQREYAQAIKDGATETTLAALAAAQYAEAQQRAGDKIKATIAGLKSTIEGLNAFQTSLKFGAGSTASPMAQYAAARAEYQKVLAAAMGGDQSAAGRLPEIARAFLDISRQVNASGMAFQRDQQDVVDAVDKVTAMFQGQMDVQQRMLDALGEGGPIVGTLLRNFEGTVAVLTAGFTEQSNRLERLIAATESGNAKVSRMLEGGSLQN